MPSVDFPDVALPEHKPEAVHFVPADERGRLDAARMAVW
jgi:hypothetical protein